MASYFKRKATVNTPILNSDDVIEIMIDTVCDQAGLRDYRGNFRVALQSLVRLARAEQLLEMQRDFNTMTTFHPSRSEN